MEEQRIKDIINEHMGLMKKMSLVVDRLADRLIEAEKKIKELENQAKIVDSFIHRHDVMI